MAAKQPKGAPVEPLGPTSIFLDDFLNADWPKKTPDALADIEAGIRADGEARDDSEK